MVKVDYQERVIAAFEEGLNCAQIVLAAFAPRLGLDPDLARRLTTGLGGGVARMGGTCGAVAGAQLVLGLRFGASDGNSRAKEETYRRIAEFHRRFSARHRSTVCRELLGLDMSDEAQHQEIMRRGLFLTICPRLVEGAVALLEEQVAQLEE